MIEIVFLEHYLTLYQVDKIISHICERAQTINHMRHTESFLLPLPKMNISCEIYEIHNCSAVVDESEE